MPQHVIVGFMSAFGRKSLDGCSYKISFKRRDAAKDVLDDATILDN
ncbi:hypothetical protein SAMN05421636_105207 [Pricia antarctica]|uniref:Uncharacterized protein n=1 Tax=Pricia antarctica TaxID=641691 RepID=A0A1G7D9L5_9FLAO|nr:hypothetical protein [Pricia antarctica]SDE47596.1 hypothetical protein SAMN05421636_105207 [Pricia antarctica]